ncbi:MAG: class I SAM-dependent methyltransferase [Firmicutes bacterium]|nr:class I SAM-dependent methyltransferase [Bacillota bacterium]
MTPDFIVTTSHRPAPEQVDLAGRFAREFKVSFVDRHDSSLEVLRTAHGVAGILVVSANKISYVAEGEEFFFHPGLARLRIKNLINGKTDQMIEAMSLKPGDRVLDCTLGLGADAITASFIAGEKGQVVGLEQSPVIASIVRWGLANYPESEGRIAAAMRRITVCCADHGKFLAGLAPGSFDIIYFDPMFRLPRRQSPAMNAMRPLARPDPLEPGAVEQAIRVAGKRVVVKERRGSGEFKRLGITNISGGKYSPVVFGVAGGRGGLKWEI